MVVKVEFKVGIHKIYSVEEARKLAAFLEQGTLVYIQVVYDFNEAHICVDRDGLVYALDDKGYKVEGFGD